MSYLDNVLFLQRILIVILNPEIILLNISFFLHFITQLSIMIYYVNGNYWNLNLIVKNIT